jgi:hypothetical protein
MAAVEEDSMAEEDFTVVVAVGFTEAVVEEAIAET